MDGLKRGIYLLPLLMLTLALAACGTAADDTPAAAEPARLDIFAMDTAISLVAYGEHAQLALEDAEQLIYAHERRFSAALPDSEISRVNARGGAEQLSPELRDMLLLALDISARSNGAFDISVYPLMQLWGFGHAPALPAPERIADTLPLVDYRGIALEDGRLALNPGQMLDLGGIAKGHTGQAAAERLAELGIESALINLGGNVQLLGARPDGSDWRVAIRDPLQPQSEQYVGIISARDTAVVTSGSDQRYFEQGGRRYHHLLDPKTGYPAESGLLSVTVVAADGMLADALSTALFVLGREAALDYWRAYGGFEFALVGEDLEVWVSAGLEQAFAISENDSGYLYSVVE